MAYTEIWGNGVGMGRSVTERGAKLYYGVEMGTIFEMRSGDGDKPLSPCHPLI